jgi:antitoxin component of RelBE/YafQ-DinJ toxin-antitoxin module
MDITTTARCRLAPEVLEEANAAAEAIGLPLAEYVRRAVIHLAKTRANPFPDSSGVRRGRPITHGRRVGEKKKPL